MRTTIYVLAAGLLACLSSCSENASQPPRINEPAAQVESAASAESAPAPVEITASVKDLAAFRALVASRAGKIVVVDLWAMW